MKNRRPLLCLDTNASIDIGVLHRLDHLGDSLHSLKEQASKVLSVASYDASLRDTVTKLFQDRHDQLEGTRKFLALAERRSTMCVPEFVEIEHHRVRPNDCALPHCCMWKSTPDVHSAAMYAFSKTALSLQDSTVLASALTMRADALVSNDDDFKREFGEHGAATQIALEKAGRPLLLLDHRLRTDRCEQRSLHQMLLHSLRKHYAHLPLGKPKWVDRIPGTRDWYCVYQHPLPSTKDIQRIVPGCHRISIIDDDSWVVFDVTSVNYYEEHCPDGLTDEFIRKRCESIHEDAPSRRWSFKPPDDGRPGHICVSFRLEELPQPWQKWEPSRGRRGATKRTAPSEALGFVETTERRSP